MSQNGTRLSTLLLWSAFSAADQPYYFHHKWLILWRKKLSSSISSCGWVLKIVRRQCCPSPKHHQQCWAKTPTQTQLMDYPSLPPSPVFANYKFQYSNMYIAQLTFTSLSQSYSCTGYIASTVHRLKQYSSEDLISWKDRVQTELAKLATIGKCRYRGVCKMGKNLFILTKASYRAPVACHLFRNVRNICIWILSQILSFWSWLYRMIFSLVPP